MEIVFELLEKAIFFCAEAGCLVLELIGVGVMIWGGIKGFIGWFKDEPDADIDLGESISDALTFLMCGEVLKTVIGDSLMDYAVLGATVALRAAMTLLIHWETKNKKKARHGVEH